MHDVFKLLSWLWSITALLIFAWLVFVLGKASDGTTASQSIATVIGGMGFVGIGLTWLVGMLPLLLLVYITRPMPKPQRAATEAKGSQVEKLSSPRDGSAEVTDASVARDKPPHTGADHMVNLIKCRACAAEISENAAACPRCGEPKEAASIPQIAPAPEGAPAGCWLLALVAAIVLTVVVAQGGFRNPAGKSYLERNQPKARLSKPIVPRPQPKVEPAKPIVTPTQARVEPSMPASQTLDTSPEMQANREGLIRKLIDQDYFGKITKRTTYPHLYVGPAFYSLTIDNKTKFVSVVYAYYKSKDPKAVMVVLLDNRSGKTIGSFSITQGLSLD